MRHLRQENAELREEIEKLRKRNAEIDAMGQVFQGDLIAQVLDNLPLAPHSPQAIFNDLTDFEDFLSSHTNFWEGVEDQETYLIHYLDFHKLGFGSEEEFWESFWWCAGRDGPSFDWQLMWIGRKDSFQWIEGFLSMDC